MSGDNKAAEPKKVYHARYEDGVARVYRYSKEYDEDRKVADFVYGVDAIDYCRGKNALLPDGGKIPRAKAMSQSFTTEAERYLKTLDATLEGRGDEKALAVLRDMVSRARQDAVLTEAVETYCADPGTLSLKSLMMSCKLSSATKPTLAPMSALEEDNIFAEIDAAQIPADLRRGARARTFEGRLFEAIDIGDGFSLSLQGDLAGYACTPRARLPHLEDYEALEGVIYGPGALPVDITKLGFPERTMAKFEETCAGGVSVGANLSWDDINEIIYFVGLEAESIARQQIEAQFGDPDPSSF